MNEPIRVTEKNGRKAISARELHLFLESKQDFTNWIKGRIEKYDLINGIDFIFETWDIHLNKIIEPINQLVSGSYRTEYILTMDAAKELSMVEGNEKGKQARRYFIECEKKLTQTNLPDFTNPAIAAREWASQFEAKMIAESKVKELEPKAEVFDKISNGINHLTFADASKSLSWGRNTLMKVLRNKMILRHNNTPYQRYIDDGYFVVKITPVVISGEVTNQPQTFVTSKGLIWLSKTL